MRPTIASLMLLLATYPVMAKDVFLTIGGGYSPSGNQASLEKNVMFFQRVIDRQSAEQPSHSVFFADGDHPRKDLQVKDIDAVPKANRLMAEFFGSTRNLGVQYRNHNIPGIRGPSNETEIRKWFSSTGAEMQSGDRLILYVAAHGSGSRKGEKEYKSTILLWNGQRLDVRELVDLLDGLPQGVEFTTVMVQCHAGGFSRLLYNDGDPKKGLSSRLRCGFFATVHDRPAAGCTPEINEANYVEYSSYFWEAISGIDRLGNPIDQPDYNGDGKIGFDEAHAYTILTSHTIDLPIKTSGEFLRQHSRMGDADQAELLSADQPLDELLRLASPADHAVLDGLAVELDLSKASPIQDAEKKLKSQSSTGRSGSRSRSRSRSSTPLERLRREIATEIQRRWPELVNTLNPKAIELLTSRSEEFVRAIEEHRKYSDYQAEKDRRSSISSPGKARVRFERFIRTAENVILAENLRRLDDQALIERYEATLAAESGALFASPGEPRVASNSDP